MGKVMSSIQAQDDPRIYVSYRQLVKLQALSLSFNLLPKWQAKTLMTGRHTSAFRGRGLNFEELKHYQVGDDIRNLDWKVTLRTGQPHVRLYTEEKDRNVVLLVDQSCNMFFSSVNTMKSVVAAELAALIAWRVLREGDRLGFLLQDANKHHWLAPQRGQNHLLYQLNLLAKANQKLNVNSVQKGSISDAITELAKRNLHQTTVIMLSDFLSLNDDDIKKLKQVQRSNDFLGIRILDPLELSIPDDADWVMGDGKFQFTLSDNQQFAKVNKAFSATAFHRAKQLNYLMAKNNVPLIEISTQGDHLSQFKRAIGA